MAAALSQTLINKDFISWLKGALAVLFAKEGLSDLVGHEIIDFQRQLLQTVYAQKGIPPGTTCSSCTTANVLACPTAGFCSKGKRCKAHDSKVPDKKPNQVCPNGLCSHIRDAIKNEHMFKGPSWINTDARRWCSDAYELSKCFVPPDGYSDKTCLADTDFNGILAIVINNKRFQKKISVNLGLVPNIFTEARVVGREIRHSANHLLSDQDLMKYIDDFITLLSDPAYLAADEKANNAVGKLKQLKTNTLTIHADDITNVLSENNKTTFSEQQNAFLRDIQDHFKNHKNDSVKAFDIKIQEYVDKQLAELKAQTEREKDELNAEKEKGITELNLQSKTEKGELKRYIEQGKYVLNIYTQKGKDELKTQLEQTDVLNAYTTKRKDELQTQLEEGTDVINTYTNKGKDEIQTQLEQGTNVLNTYTKTGQYELQTLLEHGTDVLNTNTKKGKDELQAQFEQGKDVMHTHITSTNIAPSAQTKTINELGESIVLYARRVDNENNIGIEELQEATKTEKQELEVASEKINGSADCATTKKTQYGFWDRITFRKSRLRSEFKKELVRLYNEKESMIPASPLVEDFAVPLTELYVQPPMSAFVNPNAFGQGINHSEKTPVRSYRELFLNDDNIPNKNIYVEANAGYGKTSFTQKVAMTWCQAQKTFNLMNRNFKKEDVDTLKHFEFLFLLHMRDFQGEKCNLLELIHKFVSRNLPNKEQYSEQFIAKILHKKKCLVIIDGLDEWVHPETCKRTPAIPHNNYYGSCTVLTTTRPWKLSTIGLRPNLIDRHLEISHLDDKTSKDLKSNAVKLLCENSGEKERDLTDFDRKVSSVKLGDIRLIPYILLQLICIWFNGLSIGNSKCETYSNTIELTLQRGLNKKNAPTLPAVNAERNVTVPDCMRHNVLCNIYWNLLLKLGELSFYKLFQKIKESSLVIDGITVLKFITEKELEFCLKIGLLSQRKARSLVSIKRYQVFVQHKSIQEFIAALYITSEWNNETIKSIILEVCSSISSILEMENVFVFVCGMNPEIYTCISGELQKIVKRDRITYRYRIMLAYQSMQVQCFQESVRNGNDNCSIPVPDIVICDETLTEDDVTALVKLIDCTIVQTSSGYKTLGLQSLDLVNVTMTHSNLERLYAVISQTTTLTQLKLHIVCSDHVYDCYSCDVTLDLHHLNELKMLHLVAIPCGELHVNPACLEKLELSQYEMRPTASAKLWQDLRAAPVLSSLTLRWIFRKEIIQTIPTLTQLQHLKLVQIRMGNVILSPAMTQLEHVELSSVRMSSVELKELLLSVGQLQNPVTVTLFECLGLFREEWRTIVNVIKKTPTLSLLQDLRFTDWGYASLTLKNKTV